MAKTKNKKKLNLEETRKEALKVSSKTFQEFKTFISRGNVIDMAVGTIIGAAFGKIVTSIVNDILMPLIGLLIGGIDFTGLSWTFRGAKISYGTFIQNVIDFLIVAVCIFIFIKILASLTKKKEEEKKEEAPVIDEKIELLKEIRDLLKDNTN